MSVNKVLLIGNLGQEPELKYMPDGKAVCNVNLATSETWNDVKGDKHERVEWHRLVIYGKLAEIVNQYTTKGSKIYVEGRLQTRSFDDKAGVKRYTTEIIVNNVQFLSSKGNNNSHKTDDEPDPDSHYQHDFTRDDIPF